MSDSIDGARRKLGDIRGAQTTTVVAVMAAQSAAWSLLAIAEAATRIADAYESARDRA